MITIASPSPKEVEDGKVHLTCRAPRDAWLRAIGRYRSLNPPKLSQMTIYPSPRDTTHALTRKRSTCLEAKKNTQTKKRFVPTVWTNYRYYYFNPDLPFCALDFIFWLAAGLHQLHLLAYIVHTHLQIPGNIHTSVHYIHREIRSLFPLLN